MYRIKRFLVFYCIIKCVEGRRIDHHLGNILENDYTNNLDLLKDVDLDIEGSINKEQLVVNNLKPYDIDIRHYKVKDGNKLAKIRRSRTDLWENSKNLLCRKASVVYDEKKPVMLAINCKEPSGSNKDYFLVNDNHSWVGVKDDFFYSIFNNFVLERTVDTTLELDISKELDDSFFTNNSDDFPFKVIVPNVTASVKKVVDNGKPIWSSESNSNRLLYLSVYKKTDKPLMCLITNSINPKMYFRFVSGKWHRISEHDYNSSLNLLGVDLNRFDNSVLLDISKLDNKKFIINSFGPRNLYMRKYSPKPGFKLTRIVDGSINVWTSTHNDSYCNYVEVHYMNERSTLMVLFIKNNDGKHRVDYYMKGLDGRWKSISESEYEFYHENNRMPNGEDRILHSRNPEIHMSSFKNKQGLRINTYFSKSRRKNRGAIILVHGNREYFMSNFMNYDKLWNFENFGYPAFPKMNSVDDFEMSESYKGFHKAEKYGLINVGSHGNHNKYSNLFSISVDVDAKSRKPLKFGYECTMVQMFNDLGLDVYGLDLQSYGLSEMVSETRCYAKDFQDHVDDLLQFVNIVKRGRFEDQNQTWNEKELYSMGTERFNNRLFILGYSMGGNITFQAAQQFNKRNEYKNIHFVNGVISLSGMMKIDQRFSNPIVKAVSLALVSFMTLILPEKPCVSSGYSDWTTNIEYYVKLFDGYFYAKKYPHRTVYQMFKAVDTLHDQMEYYPKDMPTLFIHCKNDPMCSIEGSRRVYDTYIRGRANSQFAELKSDTHQTTSTNFVYNILPVVKKWLDTISPETS